MSGQGREGQVAVGIAAVVRWSVDRGRACQLGKSHDEARSTVRNRIINYRGPPPSSRTRRRIAAETSSASAHTIFGTNWACKNKIRESGQLSGSHSKPCR